MEEVLVDEQGLGWGESHASLVDAGMGKTVGQLSRVISSSRHGGGWWRAGNSKLAPNKC